MKKPTLEQIVDVMRSKEMRIFTSPFNMNLGGIRTCDNKSEEFNDWLFMFYNDDKGKLCGIVEAGTTDAGLYYRKNPMNIEGTAIIASSFQTLGVYEYQNPAVDGKLGHKGQEAFRIVKPIQMRRDPDRDDYLEENGEVFLGLFATNGHDMGEVGKRVDKWSAGCWGSIKKVMDKFFELAKLQVKNGHGTRFSYTMLHEKDFK